MKYFVFIGAILIIGLGFLLYIPYDEGTEYPIGFKIFYSGWKLLGFLGSAAEKFGFSYWTFHKLTNIDLGGRDGDTTMEYKDIAGLRVAFVQKASSGDSPQPAVIYYHGGGWTIGSPKLYSPMLREMARKTNMLVISPKYRLSPEHTFPAAFDDSIQVTEEIIKRAAEFNIQSSKIVLTGDSAGGNLAVGIALALGKKRTPKSPKVCMVNSIYPALQFHNLFLTSFLQNSNPPMLSQNEMVRFFLTYIGLEKHTELIEPIIHNGHVEGFDDEKILNRTSANWIPKKYKKRKYEVPVPLEYTAKQKESLRKYRKKIHAVIKDPRLLPLVVDDEELKMLPQTNIMTCEYDILRDDGVILYERMKSLGLKVTHQHLVYGAHGLMNLYGIFSFPKFDKDMDKMFERIRETVRKC